MGRTLSGFVFDNYSLEGLHDEAFSGIVTAERGQIIRTELRHLFDMILKETTESVLEYGRIRNDNDYFYVGLYIDADVCFGREDTERVTLRSEFYDSEKSSAEIGGRSIMLAIAKDHPETEYKTISTNGLTIDFHGIMNDEECDSFSPIIFTNEVVVKILCYDCDSDSFSFAGSKEVLLSLEPKIMETIELFSDYYCKPHSEFVTLDAYELV